MHGKKTGSDNSLRIIIILKSLDKSNCNEENTYLSHVSALCLNCRKNQSRVTFSFGASPIHVWKAFLNGNKINILSNVFRIIVYFTSQNKIRSKNTKRLISVETWKLELRNFAQLQTSEKETTCRYFEDQTPAHDNLQTRMKIIFLVCKLVMEKYCCTKFWYMTVFTMLNLS